MAEGNLWKFLDNSSLSGYSLIIPSVAVGNVAQLTCDLLISSLNMKKIASVFTLASIPVLGYDPYDLKSDNLSTACEVYKSDTKNLIVLQIRAPLLYKYAKEFLQDVVNTFQKKHVRDIIILTSCFAHEKKYISTSSFRFVANDSCLYKDHVKSLDSLEHEANDGDIKIFGGGYASLLYKLCEENSIPCLLIYKYCSEGHNLPDAYEMIEYLIGVLPVFKEKTVISSQLIQPASWKLLYGRPPPQDIY